MKSINEEVKKQRKERQTVQEFWTIKALEKAKRLEEENATLRKRIESLNDEISELNEVIKELKDSHKVYFMLEDPSMGHHRYTVEFVDGSMKITREE